MSTNAHAGAPGLASARRRRCREMTVSGSGRGCVATTSVTMTPSTGAITAAGCSGPGSNIHTLSRGGATPRPDPRAELVQGPIVPSAFCTRHCSQLTRMRSLPSQRGYAELKRPPADSRIVDTWFGVARVCAGPARPALACNPAFLDEFLPSMVVRSPPNRYPEAAHERQDAAVLHLTAASGLHDRIVRAGHVAVAPVIKFGIRAVRNSKNRVHGVSCRPARCPSGSTTRGHSRRYCRVLVVALVERDLVDARAVSSGLPARKRGSVLASLL